MSRKIARSSFGCVQRTSNGKYRAFWDEGRGDDGKRARGTGTFETREEADIAIASAKLRRSGSPKANVTYSVLYAAYIEPEYASLAEATVCEYRRAWAYLGPIIGSQRVSATSSLDAETVIRAAGSPSFQRKVLRFWRKMCNRACHERIIGYNPIDSYVKADAEKRRPKRLMEPHEVAPWMEAIRGIKYEAVLLCELGGGLSPEEACALRKEDVSRFDFRGRSYAILSVSKALTSVNGKRVLKGTKNGFRRREMVVGDPFAQRILELCADGCGPLVPSGKAATGEHPEMEYASPVTISHNWRAWCERNGVPYITQGNMRSSFATLHGEALSPDSVVSGAMGHADGTTKGRHYQRVTRRALVGIADGLAEYLGEFCDNLCQLREI